MVLVSFFFKDPSDGIHILGQRCYSYLRVNQTLTRCIDMGLGTLDAFSGGVGAF